MVSSYLILKGDHHHCSQFVGIVQHSELCLIPIKLVRDGQHPMQKRQQARIKPATTAGPRHHTETIGCRAQLNLRARGKGSEEVSTEAQHGSRWPPRPQPSGEETSNPPSLCLLSFTHDSSTARPAFTPLLHLFKLPLWPSNTDRKHTVRLGLRSTLLAEQPRDPLPRHTA